jgi:hypothetical protein
MADNKAAEPSGSPELTEATATAGASYEVDSVKFNNKNYTDQSDDLVPSRQFVNKNAGVSTSGWYRSGVNQATAYE